MIDNEPSFRHPNKASTIECRPKNYLAPIRTSNNVILLPGWAGAGKTTLIENIALGLGENSSQIGVILTELNSASVDAGLDILSRDLAKVGISGCACCTSIDMILKQIEIFHSEDIKLVLVEQAPLSRADRLSYAIEGARHNLLVAALFNPYQLGQANKYIVSHLRSADVIFVTQADPNNKVDIGILERGRIFIKEVTADINPAPKLYNLGKTTTPIPQDLLIEAQKTSYQRAGTLIQKTKALLGTARKGRVLETPELENARQVLVRNFRELEVIVYKDLDPECLPRILNGLETNEGSSVSVLRALGVIRGENISIISEDSGLKLTREGRQEESIAYQGADYLIIRALTPDLMNCWKYIATNIGIPECTLDTVRAVGSLYPTSEKLHQQLREELESSAENNEQLKTIFEADTLLYDLSSAIAHVSCIPDSDRRKQLSLSVALLAKKFLEVRIAVMELLTSDGAELINRAPQRLFDFTYFGARILAHPQLSRMIESQPPLKNLADTFQAMYPITNMLNALNYCEKLEINGNSEISKEDIIWLKLIIGKGREKEGIKIDFLRETYSFIKNQARSTGNGSWENALAELKDAFGLQK